MTDMSQEAKEARAAYMRAWRRRNPEKVREYDTRHWEKVADREKEEEASPWHETTSD